MMRLGLTGSIGMGKTTTAKMFAARGVPVWDADAAVSRLYGAGAAGAEAIRALRPDAVGPEGVDRARLRAAILEDESLLPKIEAAIHPLVAEDRMAFLADAEATGHQMALLDIPLLFETAAEAWLDAVIVVTVPADVQRTRVLERPGMTEAAFDAILAKQTPDAEKRARADYVIDTSRGIAAAEARVDEILAEIRRKAGPRDA